MATLFQLLNTGRMSFVLPNYFLDSADAQVNHSPGKPEEVRDFNIFRKIFLGKNLLATTAFDMSFCSWYRIKWQICSSLSDES